MNTAPALTLAALLVAAQLAGCCSLQSVRTDPEAKEPAYAVSLSCKPARIDAPAAD